MKQVNPKQKRVNIFILIGFSIFALISFGILGISVWGDIEASVFDMNYRGEERLGSLTCPVFITTKESGKISAKISNPVKNTIKPSVRLHISSSQLAVPREENVKFQLGPNESKTLDWIINPEEDTQFGNMIYVKVYLFSNSTLPSRDATCGILVLDLPIGSGKSILYTGIGLSFVGMLANVGFWHRNNRLMTKRQRELFRAISILTVTIIVAVVASLFGHWLIGTLGIVVAFLLIVATISQML